MIDVILNAWEIQDGIHEDFERGTRRKFAVEGFPQDPPRRSQREPSHQPGLWPLGDGIYEVDAVVIEVAHGWHIFNAGFFLCCKGMPEGWQAGDRVQGRYALGIEFEAAAVAANLRHTWLIEDILIETAPLILEIRDYGSRYMIRDPALLGRKSIQRTDGWEDDGGDGDYLLRCRLLPDNKDAT